MVEQHSTQRLFSFAVIIIILKVNSKGSEANTVLSKDGDVIIEGMFPITNTEGVLRESDLVSAEAMIYEIENINRRKDILPNTTLGYKIFDDKNENLHVIMAQAIKIVSKYRPSPVCDADKDICTKDNEPSVLTKQVSVLIGPATSGNSVPVASLLGLYRIPQIGYSASSSLLSDKPRFKSFLRTIPSDDYQAQAIASLVKKFHWNYVIFIGSDDEYGRQGLDSFKKAARKLDVCTADDVNIAFQRDTEVTQQVRNVVTKIAEHERARVVILFMFESQAALILQECKRQGIYNITWIMSDAIGPGILQFNVTKALLHGSFSVGFAYQKIPAFEKHLKNVTLQTALLLKNENCSGSMRTNECSPRRDLSRVDISDSWDRLVNVINGVKAIAYGLDTLMSCQGGHCPNKSLPVNSKDLYSYIRNVSFDGVIPGETVAFDDKGDRVTKEYIFRNLVYDRTRNEVAFRTVANWSSKARLKDYYFTRGVADSVVWNMGEKPDSTCSRVCVPGEKKVGQSVCCWACELCPKGEISNGSEAVNCTRCAASEYANEEQTQCLSIGVDYVEASDPFSIMIITIGCLGLVAMLGVSFLFVHVRGTPLVQDSVALLLGLFVFSASIAFTFSILEVTLYRTDSTCRFLNTFLLYDILLVSVVLLAKTKTCEKHLQKFTSSYFKATAQHYTILMVVIFLLFQLILIGIWFLIDSPVVHFVRESEAIHLRECNTSWSAARFAALAFPILVLLLATAFAFKERDSRENHSEAKYISFCTISLCILLIAFFPTYRFVKGITTSIVIATTSLVGAFAITGCILLPKVYILLVRPERNVPGNQRSNEPTVSSAHTVSHPGSSTQPEFVKCAETGEELRGGPKDIELVSSSSSASSRDGENTRVVSDNNVQ